MNTVSRRVESPLSLDVFSDFDNIVNGFFKPHRLVSKHGENTLPLAIDVVEKENSYEIHAELPGINKDDLNVTLEDGVLTISAETSAGNVEEKDGKVLRRERRYGKFSRSLKVGKDVDENNIEANYKDGVLSLVLAKAEQAQAKKITINA